MSSESTDAKLVKRVQKGDKGAFDLLVLKYQHKIVNLVMRYVRDPEMALDITQEAFIKAYRALPRFRGDSAFGTWMHRIAVNTVLGRIRKSKRERDRIQVVTETTSSPASIGDSGDLRDLSDAIDRLPEGARHVFVLNAVYGYSHEESSDMLGIAVGTTKAQLHRARRLLAQQLKEQGFEA